MHLWTVQYLIFIRMAFENASSYMRRTQSETQNGNKLCSAVHSYTPATCNYCTLIKDKVWVCLLNPPLLWALDLHIVHKCQTTWHSRPFICSTQLSEWRATSIKCVSSHYTIIYKHTSSGPWSRHTHTHTQSLSFCWEWVLMLRDYFSFVCVCVWERSRKRGRQSERATF